MRYIPRYLIMLIALQATFVLGDALIRPDPLPSVSLKTTSGETISADLVAATGTTWYVVEPDDKSDPRKIEALDSNDVLAAQITSRKRHDAPSLFASIF